MIDDDQRAEAEGERRYNDLPEVPEGLLVRWLAGDVPEEDFEDGITHRTTGWTCLDVARLVEKRFDMSRVEITHNLRLSGRGVDRRISGFGEYSGDSWQQVLGPDGQFHAVTSELGTHSYSRPGRWSVAFTLLKHGLQQAQANQRHWKEVAERRRPRRPRPLLWVTVLALIVVVVLLLTR